MEKKSKYNRQNIGKNSFFTKHALCGILITSISCTKETVMTKAIFCDLDGTLLGSNMGLSEENSRAISHLRSEGIIFIPTSGRNFFEMPSEIRRHNDISQYLCSNGAGFYDMKSGESRHRSIPCDDARRIIEIISKMSLVPVIHSVDGRGYFDRAKLDYSLMRDYRMSEYYCKYFCENSYPIDGLYDNFSEGIGINSVCLFFKYEEELEQVSAEMDRMGVGCTHSVAGELEIFNKNAGKGNALIDFAVSHGIALDETMAIGDSMNDASMLKVAGKSVVTSGANPKLFEIAKHVGCSNDEHILDYVVRNLL